MVSYESAAGIGSCVIVILVLLPFLRLFHQMRKEEQEAGAGSRRPRSDEEGAGGGGEEVWEEQLPAAAAEQAAGPPLLVCTYGRADGWREGSCGVCLSELADGEAVRVLPACMHYFHAECVGEWLSAHATCPLCRAPLAATNTT
ncbi:unnamed protein product [Urochloa decumbens]|uniref:RING-type domain-containing protein n=1 Tax=Urochloa decumbens TaxID=240449 RepID=A0ABC9H7X0_9POAL